MKDCEKAFGGILEWMIAIIWLGTKCLQVMLGSVECTILQPILVLIQRFASDKEKAFFKKEFASAQEELERHKKVLRDAKKVGIPTLFVLKLALLTKFPCQAKKRRSETHKQDSIVVSSRSVRICSV